jgi:hypothetical protein
MFRNIGIALAILLTSAAGALAVDDRSHAG